MIQLDEKKLAKLKTTNQLLDEKIYSYRVSSVLPVPWVLSLRQHSFEKQSI